MSKYIIELEDTPSFAEDGIGYYQCRQVPWWFVGDSIIGRLTSAQDILTEIDKINKKVDEAYQRGLEEGKKATWELVADASNSEYQRGLNDAWEAARKIAQQWEEDTDTEHRLVIDDSIRVTLDSMTASEAIDKLKAYEEKQNDKFEFGDEIIDLNGVKGCVVSKDNEGLDTMYALFDGCRVPQYVTQSNYRKTGRHYDIEKILEEMKE